MGGTTTASKTSTVRVMSGGFERGRTLVYNRDCEQTAVGGLVATVDMVSLRGHCAPTAPCALNRDQTPPRALR
jgi:hypothetical protein